MATKKKRLQELRGSDFEIAKHQPDIRGWEVRNGTGHLIGKVQELIFDSLAHKVRYMVVNIADSKELQLEKRTVLVPIGLAVLEPKDDDVILENVTPYQLRALPKYHKDDLGAKAERAIVEVFGKSEAKNVTTTDVDDEVDSEFYNNDYFNEENMYRRRNERGTSTSSTDYDRQQQILRDKELMERKAEDASLKRDVDMGTPVTNTDRNTTSKETVVIKRMEGETDEEYVRRIRRNTDNI
jgi:sporulation protein YlmC with PRC-barrel domain